MISLYLSAAELGFAPSDAWYPAPTREHRADVHAVPKRFELGVFDTRDAGARLTPHPFVVVVGDGERRAAVVLKAEAGAHLFNFVDFEVDRGGVKALVDTEGHADEGWLAPRLKLVVVEGKGGEERMDLVARAMSQVYPVPSRQILNWWLRPIYCGWGDQVAISLYLEGAGPEPRALAYCIQGLYERWINRLAKHGVPVGTVIVDAGWSLAGVWTPDPVRWPDLRGFIKRQHEAGRKVLMWIPTWMREGLPDEWLVHAGETPMVADPTVEPYRRFLREHVERLLSPHGFDADGFKIDQLQYVPCERRPRVSEHFGRSKWLDGPHGRVSVKGSEWGLELLYLLQKDIYESAKKAKPDALVTSSTLHPMFHDTFDMMRLHDTGLFDGSVFDAMAARGRVSRAMLPHHPIDADDWVFAKYAEWVDYTSRSQAIGVPCIFYAERFVRSFKHEPATQPILGEDLERIGRAWREGPRS